ncbi:MAG: Rpn family recombination-promoting nuclease/putative transposase, partial [Tannerellaceae bacterium]|nr:Rpn family recombination-promoting nuclease/putative transposase [Tannerellaceae bacterium]
MVYRKQPLGKNSNVNVFLNPLTDFGFKKVFFDKKILTAFLNDMLGLSIVEIRDFPAEQLGDTKTNRKAVFDLYCITENDEHIIVEMQKEGQSNFADRALFYAAFPLRNQARRGKAWTYGLTPVYMVSILDFILFNDIESRDEVMEKVYLVRERTKTRFSDKLNFLFIELPKFNKSLEELETNIDRWLYCLKHLFDLKARPPELKGEIFDRLFEIARVDNLTTE